jgi:hypothetical protein
VSKKTLALAPAFVHASPMLARVLSVAVHVVEALPVEAEVNSGSANNDLNHDIL